jgi:hypothetical protein
MLLAAAKCARLKANNAALRHWVIYDPRARARWLAARRTPRLPVLGKYLLSGIEHKTAIGLSPHGMLL